VPVIIAVNQEAEVEGLSEASSRQKSGNS
jgi:hypothetical protein